VKRLFVIVFVLSSVFAVAQTKDINIKGHYYGANLYIFNPSIQQDSFSVWQIIINEDTITDELNTNAIELDFSLMALETKQKLNIHINYYGDIKPVIVNPQALTPVQKFKFSRPKVRHNKVQWRVRGDVSDYPIEVEQFKWKKWRVIAEVDPLDTVRNNYYEVEIHPHSGRNLLRLRTINLKGKVVFSREVKYNPPHMPEITLEATKVKEELVFSQETNYEIFTIDGVLIKKGRDRYVDVKELEKGEYWLNFDNKTITIKKKR